MRGGRSLGRSGVREGCTRVGEKILRGEGGEIRNEVSHDLPAWLESAWRAVLETQDRAERGLRGGGRDW